MPLLTRDAGELRLLARPRRQRRVIAWTIPIAAFVLAALHTGFAEPTACTAQDPCQPDPVGAISLGLLCAAAAAGSFYPRLAAWFASAFLVTLIISERLLGAQAVSPAWLYIVDLGFVGLCALRASVSQDRQPTDRALQWLMGVRRERPPAAADLPRPGRAWRVAGWGLVVLAAACLVWCWYDQRQGDARQLAATRATAVVSAHTDEFTILVQLPDQTATINVFDARSYPIGEPIELYVDDHGLRQPVGEPYDASGWIFLGVLAAGLAAVFWARGVKQGYGPRRLFGEKQPVSEVSVLPGFGVVAVYAGDARPGEAAIAEIRTRPVAVLADEDEGEDEDTFRVSGDLEPCVQPALLYGIPAPGHWCVVVVDGNPVVAAYPLSAKRIAAPPYGFDALDDTMADDDVEPTLPRAADLPLRAEQIEALWAADRQAPPDQVRLHQRSPAAGYVGAAALPLSVIVPERLLPPVPYAVALLIAGALLAVSCACAWRVFMRSRIAWNGRGIAVAGIVGDKRVEWHMVRDIEYDRDSVTIHTGYHSLVVGAGPVLWLFGRRDRNAEELATALRYARNAARSSGHDAAMLDTAAVDGAVSDARVDDLPHLQQLRPPQELYVLWILGTPLLAWILQALSAS